MTIRTYSRKICFGLSLAVSLAAVCASRAIVPEPDGIIYGQLYHRFDQPLIPTQAGQISVLAQVDGVTIATAVLASGTNAFVLRIPMDDGLPPRVPNTAKAGDQIHLFVRNNQTQTQVEAVQSRSALQLIPLIRGPVVPLNLSVEASLNGSVSDANHNGVPDYWESHLNLTVTSPRAGQTTSNAVFTVVGSANGTTPLAGVWYQLNGGSWIPASTANGFTNWMADVTLLPGMNSIKTYALDIAGNTSVTNTRTVVYAMPKLFDPLKGTYTGLFYETNGVSHETSGFFTLTLTTKGSFTGQLLVGGATCKLSGSFDIQGRAQVVVSRSGKTPLTVNLELDLTPGETHEVQGTVTDGTWTAVLIGDRAVFNAKTNPAPQAGNYTMVFPGAVNPALSPRGDGIANVTVDHAGIVNLTGTLADGTAIKQKVSLSKDGSWPLYVPLYSGKGSILSWVNFSNQPASSFIGNLSWIKTAAAGGKYYPNGFSNELSVLGSSYNVPAGSRVLNLTNATAVLSGGNLTGPLLNNVTLTAGNLIVGNPLMTNKLSLTITVSSGKVAGSFLNSATGAVTPIKGIVLPQQNTIQGFFLGTSQSGRLLLAE
jgi:hypothetical protein